MFLHIFTGVLCRLAIVSVPYLLLIFYAPFVPLPTTTKCTYRTKAFLILVITTAVINILTQFLYQIALHFDHLVIVDHVQQYLAYIGLEKLYIDRYFYCFRSIILRFFLKKVAVFFKLEFCRHKIEFPAKKYVFRTKNHVFRTKNHIFCTKNHVFR